MSMTERMTRRRGWRELWLAITGRPRAEPGVEEVALLDIDIAAFESLGGHLAYGLKADRRAGRALRRRRLREPVRL
jgi:hypothetical protein